MSASPRRPPPASPPDDPVYLNSRREAWTAFGAWVAAGVLTLGTSIGLGYGLEAGEVETVLGVPVWVIWGVLAPWLGSIVFAAVLCFVVIRDDDLGEDPEEGSSSEAPDA